MRRRSTYTPPEHGGSDSGSSESQAVRPEIHGDDELAAVLEAQIAVIASAPQVFPFAPVMDCAPDPADTNIGVRCDGDQATPTEREHSPRSSVSSELHISRADPVRERQDDNSTRCDAHPHASFGSVGFGRRVILVFASSLAVIAVGFGGACAALGFSLRQVVLAIAGGVVLAAIPIALGALAGARRGHPRAVVVGANVQSFGNRVPAAVTLSRWAVPVAILLWTAASTVTAVAVNLGWEASGTSLQIASLAAAAVFSISITISGFPRVARLNAAILVLSFILVCATVIVTWDRVNIGVVLRVRGGSWIAVIGASVVLFCILAMLWANSVRSCARIEQATTRRSVSQGLAAVGVTLPVFVVTVHGVLLGLSDNANPRAVVRAPVVTLTDFFPPWFASPLVAASAACVVAVAGIAAYSGGFAARTLIDRPSRRVARGIGSVGFVIGAGIAVAVWEPSVAPIVRDTAMTLAVPLVAWVGITCVERIVRPQPTFLRSFAGSQGLKCCNAVDEYDRPRRRDGLRLGFHVVARRLVRVAGLLVVDCWVRFR